MSKRLPYFQFEPAEWLAGDIMFCSLKAQGLFVTLKALYWQKDCDLSLEQSLKRLGNQEVFDELIRENIIKIKGDKIKIIFLDIQWEKFHEKAKINSKNGALGGRPKKQTETETKANKKPFGFNSVLKTETETKAFREEKIREDKINITSSDIEGRKLKFAYTLENFKDKYPRQMLSDFLRYWTEKNKSGTKFKQELEKTWDLERRLEMWARRDKNFNSNENKNGKQPEKPVIGRMSAETLAENLKGWE